MIFLKKKKRKKKRKKRNDLPWVLNSRNITALNQIIGLKKIVQP